jgi:hypothetical protein
MAADAKEADISYANGQARRVARRDSKTIGARSEYCDRCDRAAGAMSHERV